MRGDGLDDGKGSFVEAGEDDSGISGPDDGSMMGEQPGDAGESEHNEGEQLGGVSAPAVEGEGAGGPTGEDGGKDSSPLDGAKDASILFSSIAS